MGVATGGLGKRQVRLLVLARPKGQLKLKLTISRRCRNHRVDLNSLKIQRV